MVTYTKETKNKDIAHAFSAAQAQEIYMEYADLASYRKDYCVEAAAQSIARSRVYNRSIEDGAQIAHWYCEIMNTYFPSFVAPNNTMVGNLEDFYAENVTPDAQKQKGVSSIRRPIMVVRTKNPDEAWFYHSKCKQVRGADLRGQGIVSISYYTFGLSRAIIKDMSAAKDIMAFLKAHGDYKQVVLHPKVKEYVARILVFNGITCVYLNNETLPDPIPGKVGIYKDTRGPFCELVDICTVPPVVKKEVVEYDKINPVNSLNSIVIDQRLPMKRGKGYFTKKQICYKFAYAYLTPTLIESNLKFFPSWSPHSGRVIVTKQSPCSYPPMDLVERFSISNSYRNAFVYARIPYGMVDPYAKPLLYMEPILLPQRCGSDEKVKVNFTAVELPLDIPPVIQMSEISRNQFRKVIERAAPPSIIIDVGLVVEAINTYVNIDGHEGPVYFFLDLFAGAHEQLFMDFISVVDGDEESFLNKYDLVTPYVEAQTVFEGTKTKVTRTPDPVVVPVVVPTPATPVQNNVVVPQIKLRGDVDAMDF